MDSFTHVVSSTGVDEAAVSNACPRELLGLSCLVNEYVCLCEQVSGCSIETVRSDSGQPAVVNLTMTLIPGISDPKAVMAGVNLTGYRADFQVSRQATTATFNLRRPENVDLRLFVAESGL